MPSSTLDLDLPAATHADIPPFPSPSTFSILPDVYQLISRLSILQTPNPATTPTAGATSAAVAGGSAATIGSSTPVDRLHPILPLLEVKDLPAQVYPIKQKLAKARAAVAALPDVTRSLEDQEAEIAQLERRILALRRRETLLASIVKGAKDEKQSDSIQRGGAQVDGEEQGPRDDDVAMTER